MLRRNGMISTVPRCVTVYGPRDLPEFDVRSAIRHGNLPECYQAADGLSKTP